MRKKGIVALIVTLAFLTLGLATIVVALYLELNKPEPTPEPEPVVETTTVAFSNCSAYLEGRYLTSYKAVSYGENLEGSDVYTEGEAEPVYPDVKCEPAGTLEIPTAELDTIAPFTQVPLTAEPAPTPEPTECVGIGCSDAETAPAVAPESIVTVEGATGVVVSDTSAEPAPAVAPDTTDTVTTSEPATSPADVEQQQSVEPAPGGVGIGDAVSVGHGDAVSITVNDDGSWSCYLNGNWAGTVPTFVGCDVVWDAYRKSGV